MRIITQLAEKIGYEYKNNSPQYCKYIMWAERIKLSIFTLKKICAGQTGNCSEIRTTTILNC